MNFQYNVIRGFVLALALAGGFAFGVYCKDREVIHTNHAREKETTRKILDSAAGELHQENNFANKTEALSHASLLLKAGLVYDAAYLVSKFCPDFSFQEFGEMEEPGTLIYCSGYVYKVIVRNYNRL